MNLSSEKDENKHINFLFKRIFSVLSLISLSSFPHSFSPNLNRFFIISSLFSDLFFTNFLHIFTWFFMQIHIFLCRKNMVKDRKIHCEKAWKKTRINQFFIIIFIRFATQKSEKFPGFSLSLPHPILISSASFPYPFQCFTMSNLYKNYTIFFISSYPNLFLILYKLCPKIRINRV